MDRDENVIAEMDKLLSVRKKGAPYQPVVDLLQVSCANTDAVFNERGRRRGYESPTIPQRRINPRWRCLAGAIAFQDCGVEPNPAISGRVSFVKTADRASGVSRAIDLLELNRFHGRDLFVKPNFNSADSTPGSTHLDTLGSMLRKQGQVHGHGPDHHRRPQRDGEYT